MSKTTVKRLLAELTKEQIVTMVMDLYSARPEAKEYLDFYAEPDIDDKIDRAMVRIDKEMQRTSRGRARPRLTRIKRFIRDVATLGAGPEAEVEIMTRTIERFCALGSEFWIKDATQRSLARLVADTVRIADAGGILDLCTGRISSAIDAMPSGPFYAADFKQLLTEAYAEALQSLV